MSQVIALRASGRLKVSVAIGPLTVYSACTVDNQSSLGYNPHMPQALAGVRVLDVTQVMAGPFCGMMLADLGADVIKIEPPSGDSTRQMPGAIAGDSPSFNAVNRGKRSIVLNLKSGDGRDAFLRLARTADILIENYRPGVMDRLGLGYAALAEINPGLIYCAISGFGLMGPLRESPAPRPSDSPDPWKVTGRTVPKIP